MPHTPPSQQSSNTSSRQAYRPPTAYTSHAPTATPAQSSLGSYHPSQSLFPGSSPDYPLSSGARSAGIIAPPTPTGAALFSAAPYSNSDTDESEQPNKVMYAWEKKKLDIPADAPIGPAAWRDRRAEIHAYYTNPHRRRPPWAADPNGAEAISHRRKSQRFPNGASSQVESQVQSQSHSPSWPGSHSGYGSGWQTMRSSLGRGVGSDGQSTAHGHGTDRFDTTPR